MSSIARYVGNFPAGTVESCGYLINPEKNWGFLQK